MRKINLSILALFLLANTTIKAQLNDPNVFPIAVWLQSTHNAQKYKDAGVNMYIGLWNGFDSTQLADLTNAGMYLIVEQNSFGLAHLNDPIISGWLQEDEPDNAQWNSTANAYDPCVPPIDLINNYNQIKTLDPSRPVYLNLGQGVSNTNWGGRGACTGDIDSYKEALNGYIKAGDIISFDIYPVNSTSSVFSEKLWYVPKGIDSLKSWASTPKSFFTWIETSKINTTNNRAPTPKEIKAEVWMAIVHGANGIGYFCHRFTPTFTEKAWLEDSLQKIGIEKINLTINNLAPVLNTPNTNFSSVTSNDPNLPIDIMTKTYGGDDYIFAVAMRPGTTSGTFTVPAGSTIEVVGENRNLNEGGGQFTDTFSDFDVHIYKIGSTIGTSENTLKNTAFIYPNPTKGSLTIESNNTYTDYEVLSINGAILNKGKLKSNVLNVSGLDEGTYFIKIRNPKLGIQNLFRIIKQD